MPINNAPFDQIDTTTTGWLYNTDVKSYTRNAWQELGPFLEPTDWINGVNPDTLGVDSSLRIQTALQMDGSWRIRGTLQWTLGATDNIITIIKKDDVPFWKNINFRTHHGRSFTLQSGGVTLSFNIAFGFGSGADAANIVLGVGVRVSPPGIQLPAAAVVPCELTIYPTTT